MKRSAPTRSRFRSNLPVIGLSLATAAALVGAVAALAHWGGIPTGTLTRDPAAVTQTPPYTGFLSQVGLFFWFSAATICLFSARLLSGRAEAEAMAGFLRASAALTLLLGLDDAFLLHEDLLPAIGIPEKAVLAAYGGLAATYLLHFRRTILATGFELLALAFVFFGASVLVDVVNPVGLPFLFEDAAKLAGIVSWLSYFACTGAAAVRQQGAAIEPATARVALAPLPVRVAAGTAAGSKAARRAASSGHLRR